VRPPNERVSFDYFQQRLSVFGHWIRHPVWGDVWQPDAGANFRPYFYGYWQYTTDYGWLWVSNEPYGDIVYHYGRWAYDPYFGWLWVPGYIWGPSWVVWRESDGYIGWLAMPPGYDVVAGYQDFSGYTPPAPAFAPENLYGYQNFYSGFPTDSFLGLWVFAPNQDFGRSDRRRYIIDKEKLRELYRGSHDSTHYVHDRDRDRVVDQSIDKNALEQSTHRHFETTEGGRFLRRDTPVTSVSEGQDVARREGERGLLRRLPEPVRTKALQGGLGDQNGAASGRDQTFSGFAGRFSAPPGAQAHGLPATTSPNPGVIDNAAPVELQRVEPRQVLRGNRRGDASLPPTPAVPSAEGTAGVQSAIATGPPSLASSLLPADNAPSAGLPPRVFGRLPAGSPYSVPQAMSPVVNPGVSSAPFLPPSVVAPPTAAPAGASGRVGRGFSGRTGL
jgi:hypothetical protein